MLCRCAIMLNPDARAIDGGQRGNELREVTKVQLPSLARVNASLGQVREHVAHMRFPVARVQRHGEPIEMAREPCRLFRRQRGAVRRGANRYFWIYSIEPLQDLLQFRVQQRLTDRARYAEVFDTAQHSFELCEFRQRDELAHHWATVARTKEALGIAVAGPVYQNPLGVRRASAQKRGFA